MISFARTEQSVLSKWWWSVDRKILLGFFLIIAIGTILVVTSTPMVANRINIPKFYFIKRHLLYLVPTIVLMIYISTLEYKILRRLSMIILIIAWMMMIVTLFCGSEIKGARRWINLFGISIQPSEFAKPAITVVCAWFFSKQHKDTKFHGNIVASVILLITIAILVLQPDVGMIVVISSVWFSQFFISGLSIFFVIIAAIVACLSVVMAYIFLPHVTARVDRFLDPSVGDHYQINRSLEAFSSGGFFGVGPGEGVIKKYIPDAHADFAFSVLGEEFGFFICFLVLVIFAFIVIRGLNFSLKENSLFVILALAGLIIQFGIQAVINISSALHLIPTKGMTLPFMSYGGSSMLASSITAGMILAFSRQRIITLED